MTKRKVGRAEFVFARRVKTNKWHIVRSADTADQRWPTLCGKGLVRTNAEESPRVVIHGSRGCAECSAELRKIDQMRLGAKAT